MKRLLEIIISILAGLLLLELFLYLDGTEFIKTKKQALALATTAGALFFAVVAYIKNYRNWRKK